MLRFWFWLFALSGPVVGCVGIYNAALILLGKASATYTGLVLMELVIALLCGLVAMLLARTARMSPGLDLQTELQAQLAAEMIRKKTLKRLDVSEQGIAINGNRVGG